MSSSVSKPKAPPKPCIRSYLFKVDGRCNESKLKALDAMQAEWKRLLPVVGDHLWQKFLAGEPVSKSLSSTVGELSVFGTTPLGTGIFQQALAQKSELQGFKLVEVNPAYTSQECSACGFISRKNRKGNCFKCVCCGKQAHADAQAARNLVERFHQGRTCEYVKHTTVGVQGLELWAVRMQARGSKATPGTSRHRGVIRDVRAGLKALAKGNSASWIAPKFKGLLSGSYGERLQIV